MFSVAFNESSPVLAYVRKTPDAGAAKRLAALVYELHRIIKHVEANPPDNMFLKQARLRVNALLQVMKNYMIFHRALRVRTGFEARRTDTRNTFNTVRGSFKKAMELLGCKQSWDSAMLLFVMTIEDYSTAPETYMRLHSEVRAFWVNQRVMHETQWVANAARLALA
jgi:hypothetical protein